MVLHLHYIIPHLFHQQQNLLFHYNLLIYILYLIIKLYESEPFNLLDFLRIIKFKNKVWKNHKSENFYLISSNCYYISSYIPSSSIDSKETLYSSYNYY